MELKDLIDELCLFDGHYKRAQVDEAFARQEEIVPHLLALLEAVRADPQRYAEDDNFFGHLYAVMLLGHFREERAHQTIIDLFSLPEALVSRLFEDTITEDLPGLLLNTCGGRFTAIKTLVENREAYEYCRSSALRAITYGVVTGQMKREEAVAYSREILQNPSNEPPSNVFEEAACGLLNLYPEESMDLIEHAYKDNLIHAGYVSPDDFARQLAMGREATLEELADQWDMRNPADFHRRMEWWACFKADESAPVRVSPDASAKKVRRQKKAKRKMAKASKRKGRKRKKK